MIRMTRARPSRTTTAGFTLVELTIVLIIVGLLIGGMTVMLSSVQDTANIKETQRRLGQAQEALLGFAAGAGRLPCPAAAPNAGGVEAPADGSGACTAALAGFIPGRTLGLSPTDEQGYFLDAWGNRIRYAVYSNAGPNGLPSNAFTTPRRMAELGLTTLSLSSNPPPPANPTNRQLLFVCDASPAVLPATDCGAAQTLTDNAVAVLFSMGRNGGGAPAGDEAANTDGDIVFVSRNTAGFDDVVSWLSPNILYNRMIAAGRF